MGILHADAHLRTAEQRILEGIVAIGISHEAIVFLRWHNLNVRSRADWLMTSGQERHAATAQLFKKAFDEAKIRLVDVFHFNKWAVGPLHLTTDAQSHLLVILLGANEQAIFFQPFPASAHQVFKQIAQALFVAVVHSGEILDMQEHVVEGHIKAKVVVVFFKRFHKIDQLVF